MGNLQPSLLQCILSHWLSSSLSATQLHVTRSDTLLHLLSDRTVSMTGLQALGPCSAAAPRAPAPALPARPRRSSTGLGPLQRHSAWVLAPGTKAGHRPWTRAPPALPRERANKLSTGDSRWLQGRDRFPDLRHHQKQTTGLQGKDSRRTEQLHKPQST